MKAELHLDSSGTRAAALGKQAVVANQPVLRKLAALLGGLEPRQLDAPSLAGVRDDLTGQPKARRCRAVVYARYSTDLQSDVYRRPSSHLHRFSERSAFN